MARGEIIVNGPGRARSPAFPPGPVQGEWEVYIGIKCVYSADELCVWCGKFYRYRYKVFTYRYKVCVWFSSIGIKYVYGAEKFYLALKAKI